MWTMPSRPKRERRPADDLSTRRGRCARGRAGCASPAYSTKNGTSQPTLPTAPAIIWRRNSITPPGSCHHTAAATTRARPIRKRPAPSRRCSGSRSRAERPMERATAPTVWAMASQIEATARPSAPKVRETGPGPLRTARGAGRFAGVRARPLAEDVPRRGRGLAARRLGGRSVGSRTPRSRARTRPGRARTPRTRRGRRTGRHGGDPSPKSHQPHAPQRACRSTTDGRRRPSRRTNHGETRRVTRKPPWGSSRDTYCSIRWRGSLGRSALRCGWRKPTREAPQAGRRARGRGGRPRGRPRTQGASAAGSGRKPTPASGPCKNEASGAVAVRAERATGKVGFVRATAQRRPDAGSRGRLRGCGGAAKADAYLAKYAASLRCAARASSCRATSTAAQFGWTVTYRQTYQGVPVFGAMLKANIDTDGDLTAVNGFAAPGLDLSVTPASQRGRGRRARRRHRAWRTRPPRRTASPPT